MPLQKFIYGLASLIGIASAALAGPQEINGLYVSTFGHERARPLIYIHGGPGANSYGFEQSVAQPLAEHGFYVVVYDQRGSGRSQPGLDLSVYNYHEFCRDLDGIESALHIQNPVIIGHSFGGMIALKCLTFNPELTDKLILVSFPISFTMTLRSILRKSPDPELLKILDESPPRFGFAKDGTRILPPDIIDAFFSRARSFGAYRTKSHSQDELSIFRSMKSLPDRFLLDDMKPLPLVGFVKNENYAGGSFFETVKMFNSKIYGIYGDEDGLFDGEQLDKIENSMAPGRFKIIKGASHSVYINQREAFLEQVSEFAGGAAQGFTWWSVLAGAVFLIFTLFIVYRVWLRNRL